MNGSHPHAVREVLALSTAGRMRLRSALFVSGAAVMALEILGTRMIGPHFGVGLFVWTSLITVTLVALALGYWLGGSLADRYPALNCFAGLLFAAACAVTIIPLLREPVLAHAWRLGLRGGSLAASITLFFPSLFLLGMVSPFAVRLEACGTERAGRSAGRLYAISTTGSVLGAMFTGFVLVPSLRVPMVLVLVAVALALCSLWVAGIGWRKRAVLTIAVLGLAAACAVWPHPRPPGLVEARTSAAGTDLRVVDEGGNRYLFVDGIIQTSMDGQGRSRDRYAYLLAARLLMARPQAKTVALVGIGGGGIVPLLERQGLLVEGVELLPEVIALARARFGLSLPPARVHVMDGRVFLKQRPGRFDGIVLDAFSGDRLAYPLVSREGLETARQALSRGGILALNTWGLDSASGQPNAVGAAIRLTLQQVFRHVLEVPAQGNLLFFASDEPITPAREPVELATFEGPLSFTWAPVPPVRWPDAPILTDDWNPVDVLDIAGLEAGRAARQASFPAPVRTALAWE